MSSPKERPQPTHDAPDTPRPVDSPRLAAIDLGSNSFHLLIARRQGDELLVETRLGEKVQLAAGLDSGNCLDEDAIQRAMACLARFIPLVQDIAPGSLRVVGTSALRTARNRQAFVARAEALLGCRVEIISGQEEARLIYLGASRTQATEQRRLVVDIGGGSTEFIIGEHTGPLLLESLDFGCVTHTRRHFGDGRVTESSMRVAETDVLKRLVRTRIRYCKLGWSEALGSSGTIKAAAAVLATSGAQRGEVSLHGLRTLRQQVIDCGHLDRIKLAGLKPDRSRIFPAGVAILGAIFEALDLSTMTFTDGALREGVLHEMLAGVPAQRH